MYNYSQVLRFSRNVFALGALTASALTANANYTISDGNSSASIDGSSPAAMYQWLLNGVNNLNSQTFMIGVNGAAENTLNTISAGTFAGFNGTRGVTVSYSNAQVGVSIDYLITGTSSTRSDIGESIRISNPTANDITVHFFQYSDFNLAGTAMGDSAAISMNMFTGLYNTADQIEGSLAFSESVHTPGANFAQVSVTPVLFNMLTDGVANNLNDVVGPMGPGDLSWAFQWNFTIAAHDSVLISKDKFLNSNFVPEPSVLGLLGVGFAGWMIRRRRS
jgi:hypothetical protein